MWVYINLSNCFLFMINTSNGPTEDAGSNIYEPCPAIPVPIMIENTILVFDVHHLPLLLEFLLMS